MSSTRRLPNIQLSECRRTFLNATCIQMLMQVLRADECPSQQFRIEGAFVANLATAEPANPISVLTILQTCAQHPFRECD